LLHSLKLAAPVLTQQHFAFKRFRDYHSAVVYQRGDYHIVNLRLKGAVEDNFAVTKDVGTRGKNAVIKVQRRKAARHDALIPARTDKQPVTVCARKLNGFYR
jgi:hypothetical protein